MKKVKISFIIECTDSFYDKELKKLRDEILTGKFQKEMMESFTSSHGYEDNSLRNVKATFETIKP